MRPLVIDRIFTERTERSLNRYLVEISNVDLLSKEEEISLSKKIRGGDLAALDKLVRSNLLFVVSCAKKYQNMGMPLSDLINEGNLGLIKAARMYDETMGFKFISYAVWWIRQSIIYALSNDVRVIRIPMNLVNVMGEIRKVSEQMEQQLERVPTRTEICEMLEIANDPVVMDNAFGRTMVSLDIPLKEDSDVPLWGLLEDLNNKPAECELPEQSLTNKIKNLLTVLGEREKEVLDHYFGFSGQSPKNMVDIAHELNIPKEKVRQLKIKALRKIRERVGHKYNHFV